MPKMFLVLMILLLTNNICNAAIYKNIENDFLIDIGDNWNLSDKSTQEGGMVLIFTASDDKKSTVRVGVSPVIDEKENSNLRNMPKELLNEYFDAFIGMTKQASSKYNITFADCKNIGPHYVLLVNASLPMEIYKKDKQLPFVKSNAFIVFKKKIYLFMMDSWDTEETHLQQLTTIIKSLQPL